MKKIINSIFLVIVIPFLLFFITQFFLKNGIKINPNIYLIYFAFIVSATNYKLSYILAFVLGLLEDLLFSNFLGISIFAYILVFMILNILNNIFKNETKISSLIKILIASFVFEITIYLLTMFLSKSTLEIKLFTKILLIEISMNILLTIVLYNPLKIFKENIKGLYSKSNIYTRYF